MSEVPMRLAEGDEARMAMEFARVGIARCLERCRAAPPGVGDHLVESFLPAVEAVWWIAALDEQLRALTDGGAYRTAQESSDYGRTVLGLTWLRDRHMHQLPVTLTADMRSFFDPLPGAPGGFPFHISRGWQWPARNAIRTSAHKRQDERADLLKMYDAAVAGQSAVKTIIRAQRWFEVVADWPLSPLRPEHRSTY